MSKFENRRLQQNRVRTYQNGLKKYNQSQGHEHPRRWCARGAKACSCGPIPQKSYRLLKRFMLTMIEMYQCITACYKCGNIDRTECPWGPLSTIKTIYRHVSITTKAMDESGQVGWITFSFRSCGWLGVCATLTCLCSYAKTCNPITTRFPLCIHTPWISISFYSCSVFYGFYICVLHKYILQINWLMMDATNLGSLDFIYNQCLGKVGERASLGFIPLFQ